MDLKKSKVWRVPGRIGFSHWRTCGSLMASCDGR